jgi:predicted amidophosphoribosyltransferase
MFMDGYTWWIGASDWLSIILLAILPAVAWWGRHARLRHQGIAPGLCPVCGYDLRATPDRCPECGTIPQKKEIISN